MKNTIILFLLVVGILINTPLLAQNTLIPTPQEIIYGKGEIKLTNFTLTGKSFESEQKKISNYLKSKGLNESKKGTPILISQGNITGAHNAEEAYQLIITKNQIEIKASNNTGIYYGLQTLKQLSQEKNNKLILPQVEITDWPAFGLRGFMHDTGRNFQSMDQLKEQIDVLAFYKMNVFHWHFTEYHGWRLESKKYPQLSDPSTMERSTKFYTQNDFKELLRYCKERHITIIPEFDIPGHSHAFRKAFDNRKMRDKGTRKIVMELIDELCSMAPADEMPYIHLGTDEVRIDEERTPKNWLLPIFDHVKKLGRDYIVWRPGIVENEKNSITQLWTGGSNPRDDHRFIDSRANYINHLDPLAGMARLFFQQPCRTSQSDEKALGGILCAWPDTRVNNEREIISQNPIYPSIVFYSDAIWKGREKNYDEYWAKLPQEGTKEYGEFKAFESKVLAHRDRYFRDKEFQYVAQTDMRWDLIGPFDHNGDTKTAFEVEKEIKDKYNVDGKEFTWTGDHIGGTIHLKHFFGFESVTNVSEGTYYAKARIWSDKAKEQDFWIGFHGWSRAGGRRGGPTPNIGQWHTTNPRIWIAGNEIAPPTWKQPNIQADSNETPYVDEDYFFREPTKVSLQKGWNDILIKIPHGGNSWKWMFTCVPVTKQENSINYVEVESIKFE